METVHRIGKTYKDFIKGESVLLTLLFASHNFLLAFKMENKDSDNVTAIFQKIKEELGYQLFRRYFPIILTDNGSEFFKPYYIEQNGEDVKETKLFYCDASASQQKGSLEVTHEYIRRFIPKGISFNQYSQEDITLMINHINSVPRELFKGNTPYKIKTDFIDEEFIKVFKIKEIQPDDVILKDDLFKKDNTK